MIVLVPHTHWDREWYQPFQVFRLALVEVLDGVIERAEADPGFRFTIDGQMAAVEDYLEIRPENRSRVAALVAGGQLAVGPWQILLDEFLCTGETIVRNLEMGWRAATALGGAMPVGYLPDMFGHCAQMPQILARAGSDSRSTATRSTPGASGCALHTRPRPPISTWPGCGTSWSMRPPTYRSARSPVGSALRRRRSARGRTRRLGDRDDPPPLTQCVEHGTGLTS